MMTSQCLQHAKGNKFTKYAMDLMEVDQIRLEQLLIT